MGFVVEQRPPNGDVWIEVDTVPIGTASIDGRFLFVHEDVPPMTPFEYRVRAVRSVEDPIDPSGAAQREIRSLPSATRIATAVSRAPLGGPTGLIAVHDPTTGAVSLTWSNGDAYASLAVRRRAADRLAYATVATLPGTATSFADAAVPSGTWRYQVRGSTPRQHATTADVEITVP